VLRSADFVAIQGETNVDDPGCYGTLKMSGGLVSAIKIDCLS
jgi:hypothetical protein